MAFKKAQVTQSKLRLAIMGPSGSGKTYSALAIATALVPGGKIALIDSERGSASKYADRFDFDVCELDEFSMATYMATIRDAEQAGYDVLIIDSLSHVWSGQGGALEAVDRAAAKSKSSNSFAAWREVTPEWNRLLDTITGAKVHIIGTLRSKTEYSLEKDDRGKVAPRKVGLAPIFRENGEYEFDVVGEMTFEHDLIISKTRCEALDGQIYPRPGVNVGEPLRAWLAGGVVPEANWRDEIGTEIQRLADDVGQHEFGVKAINSLKGKTRADWEKKLESASKWHDDQIRKVLIAEIEAGFTNEDWDSDDVMNFLNQFHVKNLLDADNDLLRTMRNELNIPTAERSVA